MEPTDAELLKRWRRGDFESGELLFDRYYKKVERFFQNKVTNPEPDLVQETFTRCSASREKIKDDELFRLYIFGIAYNVLKEHVRQRYRGEQPFDTGSVSMRDLEPGPATLQERRREHRMLLEALRSIPVDDQVMLELYYWENLTTEEIAEALDIPAGTARGRLQRAREKLGEMMNQLTESSADLKTTVACLDDWAKECREYLDNHPKGK